MMQQSRTAVTILAAALALLARTPGAAAQAEEQRQPARATLTGTVREARDGTPIPGAIVTLGARRSTADTLRTETSSEGRYRFDSLTPGRYRLSVTHPGFRAASFEVDLAAGAALTLSPSLDPLPTVQVRRRDTVGVVTGRVLDAESGRPVAGAVIEVEGTRLATETDADGRYRLAGLTPGPHVLRVRFIGYAAARVPITVPTRGSVERDIRLAASPLMLEGVVVTADPVSRARGELGTASVIDQEAIRYQPAASLAGVLEQVPGVPVQPPGLDNIQQISLRSAPTSGTGTSVFQLPGGTRASDLASFGTLIVLDGVPVSNNANFQSLGPRGELSLTTAAGGGIDLRQIPASTLERVEVIRGVPSARWGDLTQGAIIVDTRAGHVEPELRAQYDARTTAVSFVGGRRLGGLHSGTATFDFAGTHTSLGRADDFAYRLAGQLMHRAELGRLAGEPGTATLRLDSRLDFFQLLDDRPESPVSGRRRSSRSRDREMRLIERARLNFSPRTHLDLTGSLTLVQQRSEAQDSLLRPALPFTDRITEGRQEGHYVIGPYRSWLTVDGNPSLAYTRLELGTERDVLGVAQQLRAGLELRREWNHGTGFQFDIEFPPQTRFNGVNGFDRPRSLDEIPPLTTSAVYLDDRLTTTLGRIVATVQAGLRLDLLHEDEGALWLSRARDALLQPRVNAELAPLGWLRLRGGWGRIAKAPRLQLLFPPAQYYDVVNVNYFAKDPVERLAVLTTFTGDPANPELGFARATKAELGVEVGAGASAASLVAFRDRIDGGFAYRHDPITLQRERFQLTDSVLGNGIKPEIIEPAYRADTVPVLLQRPANVINQVNRGFELTAFLPQIPLIRTRVSLTGSWVETRQTTDALYFGNAEQVSNFQLQETKLRIPYWEGATEVGRRVMLTYRVIHHQPYAGLIITATIQHNLRDKVEDIAGVDTLAFLGYLTRDARLVPVPRDQRGQDQYRDLRLPRAGLLREPSAAPADWMMSLQVAKTLPLDGRLNFWAFNWLDRRGILSTDPSVRSRVYPAVRVGLEVTLPVRAVYRWAVE